MRQKGNRMKWIVVILVWFFPVVILFIPSVFAQDDMEVIDNSVFDNPVRPQVGFKHDEHNERANIDECGRCHHVYDNGQRLADESSEDQRCSECHSQTGSDRQPDLMKAFHLNCKGCHKEQRKGPVMCGECHLMGDRLN